MTIIEICSLIISEEAHIVLDSETVTVLLRISARALIYFVHPLDPALIQTGAYSSPGAYLFHSPFRPALIQGNMVYIYGLI